MQLLKILFLFIVLVAVIEAQKGGTKRPKPASVPSSPSGRKAPQPKPRPAPQQPQQPQQPDDDSGSAGNAVEEGNGEGESGPEPPAVVPPSSFVCEDKPYQPGMYADMELNCGVYHMCFDGRKESFLCGTGTMFNQEILSCDHPAKVNCANSPQFYEANTELGKPGAEPSGDSGSKASAVPARPRVQQPSKISPKPAPAPSKPFVDDEQDEPEEPESPAPAPQPKKPVPRPAPRPAPRPSKTSSQKPKPQPQPRPTQPTKKTPIVQSYDDGESENETVSRRAYRARY